MPNPTHRPEVFVFEAEAKSALPVAESFWRQGFRVVAGSSQRRCLGFYSRWVRERVIYPDENTRPEECVEFLLKLVRKRRFEIIVPLGDVVSELVSRRRDEFLRLTKLVLVPYETFMIGRDKVNTMKAAREHGIPIPETFYPEEQSLDQIAELVDYPVLVKPAISNGARGIRYAYDKSELFRKYDEVSASFGRTFVQELIPHRGMQYKAELLLDRDGRVLASFAYEKIRFYPPWAGSSTLNKSVYYPEMVEYASRLARGIGWFGMCDFDFIWDVRDETLRLMEINPRVTDTIRIAQMAGIDFFRILYELACGRQVQPVTRYRTGLYMRFLPGDLLWFLTAKGKRFKTRPSFFRCFFKDTTYAVASLRDPGPIIGYLLENLGALLDPQRRAFRFRLNGSTREPEE